MTRRRVNKPHDVFQHIDMTGGKAACWPWTSPLGGKGRPYFNLDGKKVLAYRLTYELTFGTALGDNMGRHKCDNEICCNPYHLEPGTHQDNMNDMKGRERHGLPHTAVRAIKRLLEDKVPQTVIAKRYGISREQVSAINNGRAYDHVKLEEEEDGN